MLKYSAIITSTIEPMNPQYRTFSAKERLFQTVFTVSSLVSQIPNISIYIIDASLNNFGDTFTKYYKNVNFTHLNSIDSKSASTVLAASKSKGECILIKKAFDIYPEILESDFIIKASGRYFFENLDISILNNNNLDKFIFVRRDSDNRSWIDDNGYDYTGLKDDKHPSDVRKVLTSIIYSVGQEEFVRYGQIISNCIHKIDQECFYYDIENLLYYYLADYDRAGRLLSADWVIRGWNGESCVYMDS